FTSATEPDSRASCRRRRRRASSGSICSARAWRWGCSPHGWCFRTWRSSSFDPFLDRVDRLALDAVVAVVREGLARVALRDAALHGDELVAEPAVRLLRGEEGRDAADAVLVVHDQAAVRGPARVEQADLAPPRGMDLA